MATRGGRRPRFEPSMATRGRRRPQHASSEQVGGRPHSRRSPGGLRHVDHHDNDSRRGAEHSTQSHAGIRNGWHHVHTLDDHPRGWHTNRGSWRAILVSHLAILCRDPNRFEPTGCAPRVKRKGTDCAPERRRHRVVIAGSNRGRRPRVATDGSNRGRRPRVATDGSNRGRRPPRVAIAGSTPPRVAIHTVKIRMPAVVQTRGETNVSELDDGPQRQ